MGMIKGKLESPREMPMTKLNHEPGEILEEAYESSEKGPEAPSIDFEFVDMIRRCQRNNLDHNHLYQFSEHYEVESRLIEVIDQLKERAEEAEWCLNHINSGVFPGEVDSLDSLKQIIREHAELLKKVDELEAYKDIVESQQFLHKEST